MPLFHQVMNGAFISRPVATDLFSSISLLVPPLIVFLLKLFCLQDHDFFPCQGLRCESCCIWPIDHEPIRIPLVSLYNQWVPYPSRIIQRIVKPALHSVPVTPHPLNFFDLGKIKFLELWVQVQEQGTARPVGCNCKDSLPSVHVFFGID